MWAKVPNFDNYEASDEGYVRNALTGRILKNSTAKGRHTPNVSLMRKGKCIHLK